MLLIVAILLLASGIAALYTFKEIERNPRRIMDSLRRFDGVTDSILRAVRSRPPENKALDGPENRADERSENNALPNKETVNP